MDGITQFLRNLGPAKVAAMVGVILMMMVLFFFISARVATSPLSPIYSDLSIEDSSKVVSELEKMGVTYELRAGGTQIVVPTDQVLRLRLNMAQLGIPSGGSIVGYEIFDRSEAMGTSSFVMNINNLRAVEGELARTISTISQVESARVHLVIPKQELFSHDKIEPSASVMLKLRGVSQLDKGQVTAITNLLATAVAGLKPSKVTLIDSKGNMLAGGAGDANDTSTAAATTEAFRRDYESRMKNVLETLLEKSVGVGKVKVTVNADINFDRTVTNSEVFDPNGQVARSVQSGEEKEQAAEKEGKENTTAANNLPNNAATQSGTGSNRNTEKTDETTNYEISKTVSNKITESGKVNKLSVAVLVDGTYTDDTSGKQIYTPRSDAETKQIDALVKSAVGFDDKRGDKVEIVNMRFLAAVEEGANQTMMEWFKMVFPGLLQTLVYGTVAILVLLMVIRPLIKRIIETTLATAPSDEMIDTTSPLYALQGAGAGAAGTARLAQPGGAAGGPGGFAAAEPEEEASVDLSRVTGRVKSSTVTRLNELVEKHPDEALNVVRQWASRRT